MKHNDLSLHHASAPGWQLLGELELMVASDAAHAVNKWLAVIFSPLDLRADFLNKILKSAQEAMRRARLTGTAIKFEHLHLLVFVPVARASSGQSWGFFRIEKIDRAADASPSHAIEFYLYLEGP